MIQCVFEGAGQELLLQVDRNEARAGVDVFVACHIFLQISVRNFTLILCFVHGTMRGMYRLFLQRRWAYGRETR